MPNSFQMILAVADHLYMRLMLVLAALALLSGCSSGEPAAGKSLSEHDRDSILAEQPLPGAKVVGRALKERDRMESHASELEARVDSLAR